MKNSFEEVKYLLFESGVSNYRISQATGIAQSTLSDYVKGKTKVERMPVERAIKLHNYYKEEVERMRVKRTEVLTDSTLRFFALPKHAEEFNMHFSEDKTREIMMIIDEDFYKALLVNPVIIEKDSVKYFAEGALEGITPYKYKHLSTMDNITEHEHYSSISDSETADYVVSKRLKEQYRTY